MNATAVPTDSQTDPREAPGDGGKNPFHHTVRIVLVGPGAVSTAAVDSDGPGHSHGVTEDELKKGEQALQAVDAAGLPITTSGKHVTMFDVLKPTDIVVMRFEPASLRVLALPGEPPRKHL